MNIPEAERRAQQYPFAFSGGMLQRAMIAMAIACEPELLIADEPTTALDVTIQAQILDLLKELQRKVGMAIVLITHDLGVVARMADEVAVMYAGEIVEHGTADDVFYSAAHPYTVGLRAAMPSRDTSPCGLAAHRRRAAGSVCAAAGLRVLRALPVRDGALRAAAPAAVRSLRGPSRSLLAPPRRRTAEGPAAARGQAMAPLVEARGVTKHFSLGRGQIVHAVDGVTLSIAEREVVGLVGESGSGKSTFGRTLVGLHAKTAGEVLFRGEPLPAKYSPADFRRFASEIQMIFQDPYSSLNPRMTVGEIIGEGLRLNGSDAAEVRDRVGEWLRASASSVTTRRAIRTSSREGNGNASASRAR